VRSSVGVAVFGSVLFDAATRGDTSEGLRNCLVVLVVLVAGFALISPLFPRRARPEEIPVEMLSAQ
jgi:hypothetical protein